FLRSAFGAPPDRIRVIHNAVELAAPVRNRASWREALQLSERAFVACMVANIGPYKDHVTLLRAWRLVVDKLDVRDLDVALLLAGRFGDDVHNLKALAFDLGLDSSVQFLGHVDDIAGLLSAVDLGVLSSPSESSPNAILEAMASGLPVVGADNSGMREALGTKVREY